MSYINLADMPEVVLEHVFSYLTYDNIAQNRIVSKKFNTLGAKMLNKGYYMADRFHEKTLKAIKAKLPRRESERRVHPLARQCDILIAIETRLSMLTMTFSKWIDANVCCFIPGKVIDEIMRVLRCVANNPCPPRAHEILQELRDISSMAMEHFDERILPILKSNVRLPPYFSLTEPCTSATTRTARLNFVSYSPRSTGLDPNDRQTSVWTEQRTIDMMISVKMNKQNMVIAKQSREIAELRKLLDEHDAKLRDLQEKISKSQALPSTSVIVTRQAGKRKSAEDEDSSSIASDDVPPLKVLRKKAKSKTTVARGSKNRSS